MASVRGKEEDGCRALCMRQGGGVWMSWPLCEAKWRVDVVPSV